MNKLRYNESAQQHTPFQNVESFPPIAVRKAFLFYMYKNPLLEKYYHY